MERDRKLPLDAAAKRLDIAPRTLRDWISKRWIRAVRKNPRATRSPYLVPESECERIDRERDDGAASTA